MKSVYTGDEKVAEFENYNELRLGENKPAFIYEGNELVYPNPVKDGLVLWYDFSGRTNTDGQRGIAEDLSGNGNHGMLQNFNYTSESGYDKNKLLFDGVDDYVESLNPVYSINQNSWSVELVVSTNRKSASNKVISGVLGGLELRGYGVSEVGKVRAFLFSANTSLAYVYSNKLLDVDKIYHVIFYYDASVRKNGIFINGIEDTSLIIPEDTVIYKSSEMMQFSKDRMNSIHSTKLYNRPLTPSEIAHNYTIEKERFGIE